jgi:hypothetical protein
VDAIASGAVGDLVLIIPAGVIVAVVWAAVEFSKHRSSR